MPCLRPANDPLLSGSTTAMTQMISLTLLELAEETEMIHDALVPPWFQSSASLLL